MKRKPEYECIMNPPKPIVLHAQKYEITYKTVVVENFSIDKKGRKIRGTEIRCVIPTEIVGIKKLSPRKKLRGAD